MEFKFITSSGNVVKIMAPDELIDKIIVVEESPDKPLMLLKNNPSYESSFIVIGSKHFKCDCGCKLFHKKFIDETVYTCNCCNNDYQGE